MPYMPKIYAYLIRKGEKPLIRFREILGKNFSNFWVMQMIREFRTLIKDVLFFISKIVFRKEVEVMAVIYATLIVKGKKTIAQVPDTIREQVKQILIDLEVPELAEKLME